MFFGQANFNMFTAAEKNFNVKAFRRNPSPSKVRHDFLKQYGITKGGPMAKYKLYQFIRVNQEFEMRGSVGEKVKKIGKHEKYPCKEGRSGKHSSRKVRP